MISYAQNCEDVLLRRAFPEGWKGFYIDIGANDPIQYSVTKHFSLEGWRGINIEPLGSLYQRLCADRPNDVNLNIGVSDRSSTIEFMECLSNSELSTFSDELAARRGRTGLEFAKRSVPVKTLAEICEAHVDGPIDFMKIDVEGFEREAIAGNDWNRWRPRVVVVESCRTETWEPLLHAANYLSATFDGINLYYVRGEEPELLEAFKSPVSVLDNYARHDMLLSMNEINARAAYFENELARVQAALDASSERAAASERELAEARAAASGVQVLGPNALKAAHKLHDLSLKHPVFARAFRRIAGLG